MSWGYRHLVRPLLFSQDSESIHERTLAALAFSGRHSVLRNALGSLYSSPSLPVELFGLTFPNPVGLAAGMDKQAAALPAWAALGFGFVELGGVTWHPQPGNPKPRMFRAVADQALVNRMGFNNIGAVAMAQRLAAWRASGMWPQQPVGINLGKSKVTPLENAAEDYGQSFRTLWSHADFFVINVSSPNTPGLRQLQDKSALDEILRHVSRINVELAQKSKQTLKPILVKVSPDLELSALDDVIDLAMDNHILGTIATNTTTTRPATTSKKSVATFAETGGLSGVPLKQISTAMIRHIYSHTGGKLAIIGVGGIFDAADAWEKITAGASLLQIYSGLVYAGPSLAKNIVKGLQQRLKDCGLSTLADARGIKTAK